MVPRTSTRSPTDTAMWRKLLSRAHPDVGGDHEFFLWATALKEILETGSSGSSPTTEPPRGEPRPRREDRGHKYVDRVYLSDYYDFQAATVEALRLAVTLPSPYSELLLRLADIEPADDADEPGIRQETRGATFKSLAALGHRVGLDAHQRQRLYELAEQIPLSQRHVGHLFARTQ
jgi:hypothetical protein